MPNENFFLKLLETGNIRIEDGRIMIFNAHNILFPVRSFLKIRELLLKRLGKDGDAILKEVGKYQISQALSRYSKLFKVEQLTKEKVMDLGLKIISDLLGMGVYNVAYDGNKGMIITTRNNPIALEYKIIYGTSKEPIDYYICGIWEQVYYSFFNKKMKCIETKCLACGDKICQFEIKGKKS
jgi:predicted hydrocarbon binding protein